ncbi:MAG: hypothetical protein M3391_02050 [Actinomycetota bacterium]|nr:hypothetical protein [Actinomycetota bacterium]
MAGLVLAISNQQPEQLSESPGTTAIEALADRVAHKIAGAHEVRPLVL